nr:protein kinase-like domain, phloem protein 2-like protein [Tanacetum cinerariifolium]
MSSPNYHHLAHLKIPLKDILSATNNFAHNISIREADFGNHYKGKLMWSGELIDIHAQRWNKVWDEKEPQFWMEIFMLSTLKHKNLVSLVGFCDENDEKIIIIKRETKASLVNHLSDSKWLTWLRRLEICLGLAHALSYMHYDEQRDFSVIHRNIDSETVLLNDNWEPKLSEFRLSKKSKVSNTLGEKKLNEIIDWNLWNQMDSQSFNIFADIAHDCLKEERSERPNIDEIVTRLEKALELQREHHNAAIQFFFSIYLL